MTGELGRLLLIIGAILAAIGAVLLAADKIPFLGRLPGDLIIRRKNFTFYAPIATSVLVSLVISLLLLLFRKR